MRTVHLHGRLGKEFGRSHRFDVATAAEALRALNCAFPQKFVQAIEHGYYKVVRGDKRSGMHLDIDLINLFNLGQADLHIIPVAKGAGNNSGKGAAKIVLGAVIVGAAIFFSGGTLAAPLSGLGSTAFSVLGAGVTYGNIALIGFGLMLAGALTLLTKAAPTDTSSKSVGVNGGNIGNSGQQGNGVTLIYGECLVGSTPISAWSDVEDIDVYADSAGSIETAFGH
jgi:predicted phage tail protein